MASSVKVAVRVRPLNERESNSNVIISMSGNQTSIEVNKYPSLENSHIPVNNKPSHKRFVYDYSYWSVSKNDQHFVSQEQVFQDLGTMVLDAAFEGYNACVFAYGQTGAGKTYTMMGTENDPGLIPRICEGLYKHASINSNDQESFRTEVSYLEIYNEQVLDLLRVPSPRKREILPARLRVREHPKDGPYVQGLTKHDAPDYTVIESLLNQGNHLRKTAATKMNDQSSRSHAIFTIKYTQAKFVAGLPSEITSQINLVDLAGSERAAKSGATGDRLKEGGNINRSLTTLGTVISSLAERSNQKDPTQKNLFIPYRDSVLTWLLKDSLGGNSKTIMIAAIAPAECSYGETLSTLRYADRARNIINVPTVNEDPNVKLIRELKAEIERLKSIISADDSQIQQSTGVETVDEAQKLLEGTEHKMERHLRDWADKWRDTLLIMEENDLGLQKNRSTLRINMDPPHLVLLDDDPLNTSITIFSLKEGENFIGHINAEEERDLVFDNEGIKNMHCVLTYDKTKVILKALDGYCQVNDEVITQETKLSQGDVLLLGEEIRLKFNDPQEASFLRKKRRSEHRSMERSLHLSTTRRLGDVTHTFPQQPLSPESGVEMDGNEEEEKIEQTTVDKLKQQIEDLLAKYKQSEIERLKIEAKNKQELENKDKEIEDRAKELLQRQQNDEALLQQYQKELQELREQLSDEKSSVRSELMEQMEKFFVKMKNTNNDLVNGSMKDLEKHRRRLNKQLKREWSKLDQYEMKLIEVEAEKRRIIQDSEAKLKDKRRKGEEEKTKRLKEIERQKNSLQEILEGDLKEREIARKELDEMKNQATKSAKKYEESSDIFWKKLTKLEWLQYKLCTDQLDPEENADEISEILLKIKTVSKDIEILESQRDKNNKKLREIEVQIQEKEKDLKSCEAKVQQSLSNKAEVQEKLYECQQQLGEELGDEFSLVTLERDADLVKVEKDREILMSKHLEHQIALEVLVNENLESSDDDDSPQIKEIKSRVVELVRSVSPALEEESLQSQIIKKKVQIHYQQADVGKNEDERKLMHAYEEKFAELSREVGTQREKEQKVLQEKINALHEMINSEEAGAGETVNYYESECSSLMEAQKRLFDVEKDLSNKIRERREIEAKLKHVQKQMEQQAECNQEQFRKMMEKLQRQGMSVDRQIENITRMLENEAEEYLKRLKTENFTVLEPINHSSFASIANEAVDEILKEIELASHVPEFAKTPKDKKRDCGGWRYDSVEKDVHILRKDDSSESVHCFIGRGIIRASARAVQQTVSTPPSRFVYDRLLKNIRIVERIADNLSIVHMVHETQRCLLKTSRDFCFVSMHREKDGKLIIACQSVEHPSCPEMKGIQRAKILSSGWVIEPIIANGRPCSLVWYITQVFLGKSIPSKLVSLVSKRQPLSVAYLREYLVTE